MEQKYIFKSEYFCAWKNYEKRKEAHTHQACDNPQTKNLSRAKSYLPYNKMLIE